MRPALNIISRLFAWWVGALSECVPARSRQVLAGLILTKDANTAIVFGQDSIRLFATENNAVCELGHAPNDDSKAARTLIRRAKRCEDLVIAIPNDRVMHRTMSFPRKAEADLVSALQFVVEQVTPVKSEEARWDWRVSRRDSRNQMIDVELYVAPAWVIDEALGHANQLNMPLNRIDVLNADKNRIERINLARTANELQFPRFRPGFVIALSIMVLGLAGVSYSAWRQDKAAQEATELLEQARAAAQPSLDLRAALQRAEERLAIMIQVQSSTAPAAEVIDELARVLPDGTWLFEMSARGLQVSISGESDQASALLALLDESPRFTNAKFASALTRGAAEGTERFVVSFDVVEKTAS